MRIVKGRATTSVTATSEHRRLKGEGILAVRGFRYLDHSFLCSCASGATLCYRGMQTCNSSRVRLDDRTAAASQASRGYRLSEMGKRVSGVPLPLSLSAYACLDRRGSPSFRRSRLTTRLLQKLYDRACVVTALARRENVQSAFPCASVTNTLCASFSFPSRGLPDRLPEVSRSLPREARRSGAGYS